MTAYISLCRHIMKEKNIGTVIEQWYPVVERIGRGQPPGDPE